MYVCLCNPTTDKEIKKACTTVQTINELKNKLNICKGCKSCAKEISIIYKETLLSKTT